MSEERWFPIQVERGAAAHPLRIPWSVAEKAYSVYAARFPGQTAERLAERGGLTPSEMDILLPGWREECSELAALRLSVARLEKEAEEANKLAMLHLESADSMKAAWNAACEDISKLQAARDEARGKLCRAREGDQAVAALLVAVGCFVAGYDPTYSDTYDEGRMCPRPTMERLRALVKDATTKTAARLDSAPCAHEARAKELEGELSDACKLLDSALGGGPECDCQPEGHICGWPKWKADARALLDRELRRRAGGGT